MPYGIHQQHNFGTWYEQVSSLDERCSSNKMFATQLYTWLTPNRWHSAIWVSLYHFAEYGFSEPNTSRPRVAQSLSSVFSQTLVHRHSLLNKTKTICQCSARARSHPCQVPQNTSRAQPTKYPCHAVAASNVTCARQPAHAPLATSFATKVRSSHQGSGWARHTAKHS